MPLAKFRALADETRLRLLNILLQYELSVNELVKILDMGQPRVSRHLRILAEAGLVTARREGLWVFYSVSSREANAEFLKAMRPYFPQNAMTGADLDSARRMLEERAIRSRRFFNSAAENWDDLNAAILGDFDLPARVLAAMPQKCAAAADLGCGTGSVLAALRSRAPFIIGVDDSQAMLDLCRARLMRQELQDCDFSLRIGSIDYLPIRDGEVDFACINLVLHHLPRPDTAFREIHRIVKANGSLFVADFVKHNDERMRRDHGDHWLGFEPADLRRFVEDGGFHIANEHICPVRRGHSLVLLHARRP